MPTIVDKSSITKVCIDDFAFRKRYSYGTVMVNLDTHRIIDIIDSRETKQVEEWLKTYPNLEIISRDGAMAYSSAACNAHPSAIQISDRFHLLKNLSDAVEKYMYRFYPSRLVIPTSTIHSELQVLYDTRNWEERIAFAHNKRSEGYSINDIALLLHSAKTTVQKYLDLNCPLSNGHYDQRIPGKLAPYEQDVIEMRSKGITYKKIHEHICQKGYTATVASLRMFMQKERTHQRNISQTVESTASEYISRKYLCQLIYRELKNVVGINLEQYEAVIKKYPILGQLYALLKDFHRIIFSQKVDDIDSWISVATSLKIDEIDTYVNGITTDIEAVKNSIRYKYSNGLAEGSVNKIKLIKRVMYGRNSFYLLKAKILLGEYYYQIN